MIQEILIPAEPDGLFTENNLIRKPSAGIDLLPDSIVQRRNIMKKICVVLGLLLLLAIAGTADAQSKKPNVGRSVHSQMDTNGDKVITVTEHAAFWQKRFKDIDIDNDGKLTAAEFHAATKEFFGNIDVDKNGTLVAKEYFAFWCGPQAKFPEKIKVAQIKKLDADQNDKISANECVAYWAANLYNIDQNHDDVITLDEFIAAMSKRFKEIDHDGDGLVSIQEHAFFMTGKAAPVK